MSEGEKSISSLIIPTERELLRMKRILLLSNNIDDCSVTEFVQDMTLLTYNNDTSPINVIISSGGGEVEPGLACVRAIRKAQQYDIKIIGQVYGHAMSMAFLILQCCDERVMGTNDVLMIHGIVSFRQGDIRNLESEKKLLDYFQKHFANMLSQKCKWNFDRWSSIMKDATPLYFDSEESLEHGLVDKIE